MKPEVIGYWFFVLVLVLVLRFFDVSDVAIVGALVAFTGASLTSLIATLLNR